MQTWSYELVVPQKLNAHGEEEHPALRIAHADGLLEKPYAADLLVKHAQAILDANRAGSEVSVNVVPFGESPAK